MGSLMKPCQKTERPIGARLFYWTIFEKTALRLPIHPTFVSRLPAQRHHAFQVLGLGEQVEGLYLAELVTRLGE